MPQSEVYLDNYWKVYLEFVDKCIDVKYKGIPLALMINFYQYLDEQIKTEINSIEFNKYLSTKYIDISKANIQPIFERWLEPLKKDKTYSNGKILLSSANLRFTRNSYKMYFDSKETIMLAPWSIDKYFNISVHNVHEFKADINNTVNVLKAELEDIFNSNSSHILMGNKFFHDKFMKSIYSIVNTIALVDIYLEQTDIACIIIGSTENLINRVLSVVGSQKGIPSICMQHGLIGGEEAFMPMFSSVAAVYGNFEKEWYLERGLKKERISIIGHLKYDDIFTLRYMSKTQFRKKYNIRSNKKIILIATQPFFSAKWNELIIYLSKDNNCEIIIKPHPWELSRRPKRIKEYEKMANEYSNVKVIVEKKVKPYNVISNIDILLTQSSTIGLEAMLFKKHLLLLDNKVKNFYNKLENFNFSSSKKLAKYIIKLNKSKKMQKANAKQYKKFLEYAYPQELAGLKLKKLIAKLIK
ncbi:hypothetical protein PV797_19880 [Clostridiaceae bacterium M8S5]|nr:hypothetical protein PV797_19880 [Clostridiaceae bacterium M8S5]